jgi:hypothetical protein
MSDASDIEALKLRRMRVRNELSFLRSYKGSDHDEQERALQNELHELDREIEKRGDP